MHGRGSPDRRWLLGTLAFAACFWLLDLAVLRSGVPDLSDDIWEYGAAARELLQGHGFRTTVVHPPLWALRDPATGTVPLLIHGPLLPLALVPRLWAFGPRVLDLVAWGAALLAIATAWQIFRLGTRHFGAPIGAAGALVWTLSPLTLRAVHHDVSLVLGAVLLVTALDFCARAKPLAILAGLALGLGTLVRPEMLLAAPVLLVLARGAWPRFALPFLACLVPWWWHNVRATGSPLFNLSSYLLIGYWDGRPGLSVLRDFHLPPRDWPAALFAALPGLWAKWLDFLPHALKRALLTPSGATGWLVLVGAVAAARAPDSRRLALAAAFVAAIPVAVMTVTLYDPRYLAPFLPLWSLAVALGARAAVAPLPEWAHRPRAWMGLTVLLLLPSVAPAMKEAAAEARVAARRLAEARETLRRLPPGAPVFTDAPDFVAWSTGRPAVWVTPEEFARLPPCDPAARAEPALPCRGSQPVVWLGAGTTAP